MHGCGGEIWKRDGHMLSVPTSVVVGDYIVSSSTDSFFKGARKVSVGDCALFEPPQGLPSFIGIIRWLTYKGEHLHLGVNWLYRPAEVKLGKGILLDAEPNEVFYSFHQDEIPAASLLHPCKVAFLPKGVKLSQGTPSFVCRRVYDIAKERLWWLTGRNYIDERQEEVDNLLFRTQKEMHATVQSGGRSPKPVNGPMVQSQLKSGSDSVQNSATLFSSHNKRRKRDHSDQGSEVGKRERSSKTVDGDSLKIKTENTLKFDIANITEKGGLVKTEGVEKLLQLMWPDTIERKMDLLRRSMLANVIAMTDKFDCLTRFVQLKGLSVFDEWLQDIHKGKISSKEGDKSVEDFLLVLLRALDKLPVNLHALQTCNIGRSVNHLRTQKSVDIQRKARGLVETWKKRVEAEMNIVDSKSGITQAVSWPSKSNGGPGCSSENVPKNSDAHISASKSISLKPIQGDSGTKSASPSPGAMNFSPLSQGSGKDCHHRISVGSASDLPSTPAREEKSSSSSQSHNYSQSLYGREDGRSSTAGSMCVNKSSGSRHRNSNGFPGSTVTGNQKETGLSRTISLHKGLSSERASGLTCETAVDVPAAETRNHKLIVKIPNRSRSPGQSATGGLCDETSIMNSRASSPVLSDKTEQLDPNGKETNEACRANVTSDVNTESWQSNDFKDVLTGSDEGDGSPAAICDENRSRAVDDTRKAAASSIGCELKSGNLQEDGAKYSEANTSLPVGDDVGINLLASVATGEIFKSYLVSPTDSPQRNLLENSCTGNECKLRSSAEDNHQSVSAHVTDVGKVQGVNNAISESKGGVPSGCLAGIPFGEKKSTTCSSQEVQTAAQSQFSSYSVGLQTATEQCLGTSGKNERKGDVLVTLSPVSNIVKKRDGKVNNLPEEKKVATVAGCEEISRLRGYGVLLTDNKTNESPANMDEDEKRTLEVQSSHLSSEQSDNKKVVNDGFSKGVHFENKQLVAVIITKDHSDEKAMHSSGSDKDMLNEDHGELDVGKADGMESGVSISQSGGPVQGTKDTHVTETQESACVDLAVPFRKSECTMEDVGIKEAHDECSTEVVSHKASPVLPSQEREQQVILTGLKPTAIALEEKEELACTDAYTSNSTIGTSDVDVKPKFDLNEGFNVDDGNFGEASNLASVQDSSARTTSLLPKPVSGISSGIPATITVTAAAKGAFVPPENLMRSRREVGWKGSAATSAFRPAEPRKCLEMQLGLRSLPLPDVTGNKNERPIFDFDLNVADERISEDMSAEESIFGVVSSSALKINNGFGRKEQPSSPPSRASGGCDLDLNYVDDANEVGHSQLTASKFRLDTSFFPVQSTSSSGFPHRGKPGNFDLNNGPVLDDCSEAVSSNQHGRGSVQFQLPAGGIRMNSAELGNFSAWLHPGSTYSPIPVPVHVPSIFHDRGDKPFPIVANQRIAGPPSGCTPDFYRGSVLSSSPALPFPATPFQYPVFPFGSTFPVASSNLSGVPTPYMDASSGGRIPYPGVNSQWLGHATSVSSHVQRPYMGGLPDVSSNGGMENIRKFGMQDLDLNAGPGGLDMERKEETFPLASRQFMVAGSQALSEEQARMHQLVGGVLKRKEPEGNWGAENFRYRQFPGQ